MSSVDHIQAPPPLYKYKGEDEIHQDNRKLEQSYAHDLSVLLDKKQQRELQKEIKAIQKKLEIIGGNELARFYALYIQQVNSYKLDKSSVDLTKLRTQEAYFVAQKDRITEAVKLRMRLITIRRKINAHLQMQAQLKEDELLRKMMVKEAKIICEQITQTLARNRFVYYETIKDKSIAHYVEIESVDILPDQLQIKLAVARTGLGGGKSEDLLPTGVAVSDILTQKILNELSVAAEREVWSPQTNEDVAYSRGAYLVVERMGLYEGIPVNVSYRQLMARYETADHARLPIPAGLRRGRRINWLYLDSSEGTHMLVTGITGSGKSNFLRAMLCALVERQRPQDIIMLVIDLKNQGDFNDLADAPHFIPVGGKRIIHKMKDVVSALNAIRGELHWRQARIGAVGKKLSEYNARVQPEHRLPRILVLFDEYAQTRAAGFESYTQIIDSICAEITRVGRSAGIHLVVGIQTPRAGSIRQDLRDNLVTQYMGSQSSIGASQSVSGNRKALKVDKIPGRMYAYQGMSDFEVQMPLITDEDVKNAVHNAQELYADFAYTFAQPIEEGEEGEESPSLPPPPTEQQIVLDTAFNVFEGGLKISQLEQYLKGTIGRRIITRVVDEIVQKGTIEYQGVTYEVAKESSGANGGRPFVKLVEVSSQ